MTASHEQILADLEDQLRSDGVGLADIDARIAQALEVPPDYYFAYLLVWGALEARRAAHDPDVAATAAPAQPRLPAATAGLADRIAWLGCRIYQQASPLGRDGIEVALIADELLGVLAELRGHLAIPELTVAVAPAGRAVHHG